MDQSLPIIPQQNIDLIGKDIQYIQRDISAINASIKELSGVYATKTSVDDTTRAIDYRVAALERSSGMWKWLGPTLSAFGSAVLTFLLISFLQHPR